MQHSVINNTYFSLFLIFKYLIYNLIIWFHIIEKILSYDIKNQNGENSSQKYNIIIIYKYHYI